ncbi:hypothetical protein Y1Q_0024197 [Alligator mississippiensis]|uniref:Uncharacterized protein n=1 Tax=Alligator mississippiensis TaxID=8496 RepID=A0A151NIH2_ALLMI|nr:hypothetical protein Y1Q_0024197 [Alligator mississippiensis]
MRRGGAITSPGWKSGTPGMKQGNSQLGLPGERQPYGGGLPLQVQVEQIKEVLESGPGHPKGLQPLFVIIPGALDDIQPPVLAGWAGSQVVELKTQELVDGTGSIIHISTIGIPPARVQVAAQGLGGISGGERGDEMQ